jgi:hypothetical protein
MRYNFGERVFREKIRMFQLKSFPMLWGLSKVCKAAYKRHGVMRATLST